MFDFKDQVVIVTGSGSKRGIGRGIANMFAEAGAQVIIADMNEQGCKDTVAEIQAAGYKADGFVLRSQHCRRRIRQRVRQKRQGQIRQN